LFFSVQGTGGSPTGPDPENRLDDQDIGSPGRPVSSGLLGTSGSPTGPDPENRVGDQDTGSPGRPVYSEMQELGVLFLSWSG
jgi:hypothetical protein